VSRIGAVVRASGLELLTVASGVLLGHFVGQLIHVENLTAEVAMHSITHIVARLLLRAVFSPSAVGRLRLASEAFLLLPAILRRPSTPVESR
jgi:hypothetical protein